MVQIDSSDFRLASDWLQSNFRLVVWKTVKKSYFILVQIGSDWLFRFQIGFRLLSDSFQTDSLKNCKSFRFHIYVDCFRLTLQISDWLQIGFRFIPDFFLKQIVKASDFRLVQIGSDWLDNELLWIFAEFFLWKCPEMRTNFSIFLNILSTF